MIGKQITNEQSIELQKLKDVSFDKLTEKQQKRYIQLMDIIEEECFVREYNHMFN